MKKIRTKIIVSILGAVLCASLLLCYAATEVTKKSTSQGISTVLTETVSVASSAAENMINSYTYIVGEIASAPILIDENVTLIEKQRFLEGKVKTYYMRGVGMADVSGRNVFTGEDVKAEAFFQSAASGSTYMSSPYISDDKTDMYLVVSAPVKKDDQVIAVVYFNCDTNLLTEIVEAISVGEKGDSYILDQYGTTIAYKDRTLMLEQSNAIAEAKANPKDKELQALATIEMAMVSGKSGMGKYMYNGISNFQAYGPIQGSDGWSIAVAVDEDEFMTSATVGAYWLIGFSTVICLIGLLFAYFFGSALASPIIKCTKRLSQLAEGDLTSPIETIKGKDEISILASSMEIAINKLKIYVEDIDHAMSFFANNNFAIEPPREPFIGDFKPIETAFVKTSLEMSSTLLQIRDASYQVASGSNQVSAGAQVLAQGATEQANSVQELSTTIFELSEKVNENAAHANQVAEMASTSANDILESNHQMQDLMNAMEDINTKSIEIGKIIKTIEDIAYKSNILSLNAAVEAARAGASGKSFAVVADEVKSLAAKSSEAAKSTAKLIESSMIAVESGVELAQNTANNLMKVVQDSTKTTDVIREISQATAKQASAISQVSEGLNQISAVVQTNSATSQESAAISEELSGQASIMRELLESFTLRE